MPPIDRLDAFKTWLAQSLAPICDADPVTLGKYVIALIKKSKTDEDLQDVCMQELDVFLQQRTKDFTERLIHTLRSKSYIPIIPESSTVPAIAKDHMPVYPGVVDLGGPKLDNKALDEKQLSKEQNSHVDDKSIPSAIRSKNVTNLKITKEYGAKKDSYYASSDSRRFISPRRGPERKGSASYQVASSLTVKRSNVTNMPMSSHEGRSHAERSINSPSNQNRQTELVRANGNRVKSADQRDGRYRNGSPRPVDRLPVSTSHEIVGRDQSNNRSATTDRRHEFYQRLDSHDSVREQRRKEYSQNWRDDSASTYTDSSRLSSLHLRSARSRSRSPSRSTYCTSLTRDTRSRSASRYRSFSPSTVAQRLKINRRSESPLSASRSRSSSTSLSSEMSSNVKKTSKDGQRSAPAEELDLFAESLGFKSKAMSSSTSQPLRRLPRCRDYDEKGVCVRGDQCPYDHGSDPVVVNATTNLSSIMGVHASVSIQPSTSMASIYQNPPPGAMEQPLLQPQLPHSRPIMSAVPQDSLTRPPALNYASMNNVHQYLAPPPLHGNQMLLPPPNFHQMNLMMASHQPPPINFSQYAGGRHPLLPQSLYQPAMNVSTRPAFYLPATTPQRTDVDIFMTSAAAEESYKPRPYIPVPSPCHSLPSTSPAIPLAEEPWDEGGDQDNRMSEYSPELQTKSSGSLVTRHSNLVPVPTFTADSPIKSAEPTVSVHVGMKRSADMAAVNNVCVKYHGSAVNSKDEDKTLLMQPLSKKRALDRNLHLGLQGHPGLQHLDGSEAKGCGGSNLSNTTLELRRIPKELNTIAKINEHFTRFGIIVNLKVGYENDPEAALVSFASSAQANAAYRCSEPLFNNRFIKFFWHNSDRKQALLDRQQEFSQAAAPDSPAVTAATTSASSTPPGHKFKLNHLVKQPSTTDALSGTASVITTSLTATDDVDTSTTSTSNVEENKPTVGSTTTQASTPLATGSTQMSLNRKPAPAQLKKEALKKQLELQKQSHLLLEKQLGQQKLLIQKLQKTTSKEERAVILKTISMLSTSLDKIKSAAAATPSTAALAAIVKPVIPPRAQLCKINTVPRAQPFVGQTADATITAEKERETRLRTNSSSENSDGHSLAGVSPAPELRSSYHSRGRGWWRGGGSHSFVRGGGVNRFVQSVDRRPKQLIVTGFDIDEQSGVLVHLQSFGPIVSKSLVDATVPSLSVTYSTRQSAEQAAAEGCSFRGKRLVMTWQKPSDMTTTSDTMTPTTTTNAKDCEIEDPVPEPPPTLSSSDQHVLQEEAEYQLEEHEEEKSTEVGPCAENENILEEVDVVNRVDSCESDLSLDIAQACIVATPGTLAMRTNSLADISIDLRPEEIDEDALLGIDEDDDDDKAESRSWRR